MVTVNRSPIQNVFIFNYIKKINCASNCVKRKLIQHHVPKFIHLETFSFIISYSTSICDVNGPP